MKFTEEMERKLHAHIDEMREAYLEEWKRVAAQPSVSAQNIGAGNVARIRQGFRASTIIGIIYAFAAAALVMTVGKYMSYLFVSGDAALIMDSVDIYLKCVGTFFIPLTIVNVYRNGIFLYTEYKVYAL